MIIVQKSPQHSGSKIETWVFLRRILGKILWYSVRTMDFESWITLKNHLFTQNAQVRKAQRFAMDCKLGPRSVSLRVLLFLQHNCGLLVWAASVQNLRESMVSQQDKAAQNEAQLAAPSEVKVN